MVPEGWTISTLPNVIGINGIITDGDWIESKDQDPNGDVRLIQLADIGDGRFINKSSRYLTSQKAKDLKCTYLHPGDILIARMPEPLGRACIFPGVEKPSISVVDVCIIHTGKNVDRVWLTATINSQHFRGEIVSRSSGTTRTRISRKNLAQIKILLPQFEEQQKIAAILSSVDDAIQATQAVIDQTRRVKQGLLQQLLTRGIGHTRFKKTEIGEIPEEWSLVKLGDVANESKERFVPNGNEIYTYVGLEHMESGINRILRTGLSSDVTSSKTVFKVGDTLFGKLRPYLKKVALSDIFGVCSTDILAIRPSKHVDPYFLCAVLSSDSAIFHSIESSAGTKMPRTSWKEMSKFKVLLPKIIEQKKIAAILKSLDEALQAEQAKLQHTIKVKKGLMQDLLTGRVRVKLDGDATT